MGKKVRRQWEHFHVYSKTIKMYPMDIEENLTN